MTLLNPYGLLLLLSIPVIVLLHLFRQERRRQEVSSLFLWREISDQHSRRIRPRLLRNVNLLLQVLAALFAALALAQPILTGSAGTGAPKMIVLVDASASMAAIEGQVTRLELAKNRAREVVGRSRRDTEIMIATAGPLSAVEQGFTTDRTVLYEVIRTLEAQDGPGDLNQTVEMIRSLGNTRETDIVFVTDAAFPMSESIVLPGQFRTERVGTVIPNRAITEFRLRRRFDGSALEAYVELANFDKTATTLLLELKVDGRTISRRDVSVGPDEIRRLAVNLPGVSGSVFEARLVGNEDALSTDDSAFSVASSTRPLRVQLVTEGNYFLESILSVYPDVLLVVTPTVDQSAVTDLFVFDGVDAPAGLSGSILAIATAMPDGPFEPLGFEPIGRAVTVNRAHPIAADLDLSDVTITQTMTGTLSGRSLVVAAVGAIPLIYTYTRDGVRLVGFTFSLADSDLGLRSSFPVLMNNIITWLAPSPQETGIGSVSAGAVVPLLITPGAPVRVTYPSGKTTEYELRENTLLFRDTVEAGIYTVQGADFSDLFAVTLASSEESNLTPRFPADQSRDAAEISSARDPGRPLWQWLAAFVLLLLVADWIVWARRT
ncbi:MAG: VWA domain-containing protein [Spirochaetia bacterium]